MTGLIILLFPYMYCQCVKEGRWRRRAVIMICTSCMVSESDEAEGGG